MRRFLVISLVSGTTALSIRGTAQPNPPTFPSTVHIIDPSDATAQETINNIFAVQGGHVPCNNGQFVNTRAALLFKPGTYTLGHII